MITLDFSQDKVQSLDYETLLKTVPENDYLGKPIGGHYHYEVIDSILDIIGRYNVPARVEDMFAAKNNDSKRPGVSILPEREERYGKGSPESFILRRVYATIVLGSEEDGIRNAIAISYNQNGIQVGFGPNVKICHNQTILGSEQLISNYGYGNVMKQVSGDKPFWHDYVEKWVSSLSVYQESFGNQIQDMQMQKVSREDFQLLAGRLLYNRLKLDGGDRKYVEQAPVSCAQLNSIVRDYQESGGCRTKWDIANLITAVLKPRTADMATMMVCNLRAMNIINDWKV